MNKLVTPFLFILVLLGSSPDSLSEPPKAGLSPYGIQSSAYNCDSLIDSLNQSNPKGIRYSWLYNSFNNTSKDGLDCVKRLNNLPNTNFMEVHLINEVCQRNKNCGDYELLHDIGLEDFREGLKRKDPNLIGKVTKYIEISASQILPTLTDKITCAVSPGLESNLDHEAALVLLELTKKYFGERCKLVWNPVGNNKYGIGPIEGTIHELHGAKPKLKAPCISNLDGIDIELPHRKSFNRLGAISYKSASKYLKSYSHCEASFLWIAEENCLEKGGFIDPRERTKCTNRAEYESLNKLVKGAEK